MSSRLRSIRRRRAALAARFDTQVEFEALEESCVPSYCHPNPLAAAVSWARLLSAARLFRRLAREGPVLDFGAATGEIFHVVRPDAPYHFVEQDERLAAGLVREIPDARREVLERLPSRHFATVFALDSLEHNDEVDAIAATLIRSLRPDGVLIVSGPTESLPYRIGRRVAGFTGHYHVTNVYDVERSIGKHAERVALKRLPPVVPLFRISAWRPSRSSEGADGRRPVRG